MSRTWITTNEKETRCLGQTLARELLPNGTLLLRGNLGIGKTVLAQGVAQGLGIDPGEVQSPSFTLVRHHRGELAEMIHIDLYRLEVGEVEGIGIWEILESPGVKVVEWSERLPLPVEQALRIAIRSGNAPHERVFKTLDRSIKQTKASETVEYKGETG